MSEILTSADVQSRLEALCDTYGTGKVQKAREVYAEIERLRLALETATRESDGHAANANVCPRCACRARTPEEIADAHSPRAAAPPPVEKETTNG